MNRYVMIAAKTIVTTGVHGTTLADVRIPAIPAVIHAAVHGILVLDPGTGSGGL